MTLGVLLLLLAAGITVEFLARRRWDQRDEPEPYLLIVVDVRPVVEHRWTLTRDRKKSIYSRIDLTLERRALTALAEKTACLN